MMRSYVCGLFKFLLVSQAVCLRMLNSLVNNEFEAMWNVKVFFCLEMLCWNLPEGTETNHKDRLTVGVTVDIHSVQNSYK